MTLTEEHHKQPQPHKQSHLAIEELAGGLVADGEEEA